MSVTERVRRSIFSRVPSGELSVAEAGRKLGLSERQARRIWKRYRAQGDAGLIHGLRGRVSNAAKGDLQAQVLACYQKSYAGFNAAHATEKLAGEGLVLSRQTLWRWLAAKNLVPQPRRSQPHRQRRTPRESVGELVQMDGSTHDWFGGRGPVCVLFVMIDDANGRVFCRFYKSEDTQTAFDLFGQYAKQYGLPLHLYVDKDSIYRVNDPLAREQGQERGQMPLTQFGRAMETLGVNIICANSPQAKGRVERMNGTLQDRLVQELKLAGIGEIATANTFLEQHFLKAFNHRFMRTPGNGMNVHQRIPQGVRLAEVLCTIELRTVGEDWCIRWANRIFQIEKCHVGLKLTGKRIEVLQLADGTLKLRHHTQNLRWKERSSRPRPAPIPKAPPKPQMTWRPGPDHPWKKSAVKAAPLRSVSLRSPSLRSAALTATP